MTRPQQHLAQVVNIHGTPNGTAEILSIIEKGVNAHDEARKAERLAEKGTDKKANAYITDAGKCIRAVVLSLLNVPESDPFTLDSKLRFILGHAYEDAIAKIIEAYQGATFMREERVEIEVAGFKITGRRDFDAVRLEFGDAILELKSTNARSMAFKLKEGKPDDAHVSQANLYLHATGRKTAFLIYLVAGPTKGEPLLHAWRIEYDAHRAGNDLQSLVTASEMALRGKVPPIPQGFKSTGWPCSYCNHRGNCWKPDSNLEALLEASIKAKQEAV